MKRKSLSGFVTDGKQIIIAFLAFALCSFLFGFFPTLIDAIVGTLIAYFYGKTIITASFIMFVLSAIIMYVIPMVS